MENKQDQQKEPLYFDFIEYVRDPETFADKEYKKWLAERERNKKANDRNKQVNHND